MINLFMLGGFVCVFLKGRGAKRGTEGVLCGFPEVIKGGIKRRVGK
jgi:hypothetical protein